MFWFFFYIGSDRVSGVPKAAKNNQNCTCSKLSITTRLQTEIIFICWSLLVPGQASQENLLVRQVLCTSRAWQFHTSELYVMFTEIVSNIIAWCHVYRDCVKYQYLGVMFTEIVSNIIAWCHVYRDCVKYYRLNTKIYLWHNLWKQDTKIYLWQQKQSMKTWHIHVSWSHVFRDCFCCQRYIFVSCFQRLCQRYSLLSSFQRLCQRYILVSCFQRLCLRQ
jgi:hypothetical protein